MRGDSAPGEVTQLYVMHTTSMYCQAKALRLIPRRDTRAIRVGYVIGDLQNAKIQHARRNGYITSIDLAPKATSRTTIGFTALIKK